MSEWWFDLLDFWFGLSDEQHWRRDAEVDAAIAQRFGPLWQELQGKPAEQFIGSPEQALAAVILFDQFPRNMFRDDPRAFATDPLARRIAKAAIARGLHLRMPGERRHFLFMPLQHSEALDDQDQSVALFEELGDAKYLDYARRHRDVIFRFGRFPHRNALLGREPTDAERAFGLEEPW